MGNDEYMRQMFDDKLTVLYVPDRVCEIVRSILHDEREKYISELFTKLNAIELCFGGARSQRLEEVGAQLSDLYSLPIQDANRKKMLMGKVAQIARELMGDLIQRKELPGSIKPAVIEQIKSDTEKEVSRIKHHVKKMQVIMSKTFQEVKAEVARKVGESQRKLRAKIREQQKVIDGLNEQLKQTNDRNKQSVSELQRRNTELEASLSKSTANYQKKHQKAKEIVAQLSNELSNSGIKLAEAETRIKQTQDDNNTLKAAIKKLSDNSQESRMNQLMEEIAALKSENQGLRSLEKEIAVVKAQNEELVRNLQEREQKMKAENLDMEKNRELIQRLDNDLKQARLENAKLKEEFLKIPSSSGNRKSWMEGMGGQLSSREEFSKTNNLEIQRLQHELQKLEQINEEQAASVEALADQNEQLRAELKNLQRVRRGQPRAGYPSQQTELMCTSDDLQSSIINADDWSIEEANKTILKLKHRLLEQDQVIQHSNEMIAHLTNQIQEASGSQSSLRLERESKEKLKIEYESLQEHCTSIEEALSRAKTEIERLTQDNADLYKYKTENEVLQSSSKDIAKELKVTKQKLNKKEQELQAAMTPSQRKLTDQVRDLSRELKDVNTRISRIIMQTAKSFKVETLDDIPKALSEAKQEVNRANMFIAKIRAVFQVKCDEDLMATAKRVRQQHATFESCLKEIETTCGVDSFQKIGKEVAELKSQLHEVRDREQRLCNMMDAENPAQLVKQIRKISATFKLVQDICAQLQVVDEAMITDRLNDLIQIQTFLCDYVGSTSIDSVKRYLTSHCIQMEDRQRRMMRVLSVTSETDLEPALQDLMNKQQEYDEIYRSLSIEDDPSKLKQFVVSDNICSELCKVLRAESYDDIMDTVTELLASNHEMSDLEDHMMIALAVVSPESIVPKLEELHSRVYVQREVIQNICDELHVKNENDIQAKIEEIVQQNKDLATMQDMTGTNNVVECLRDLDSNCSVFQGILTELCAKVSVRNYQEISTAVDRLLNQQSELMNLQKLIPSKFCGADMRESITNILACVSEYEQQMTEIEELLDCAEYANVKQRVTRIRDYLSTTSELFSKIMSYITSSEMHIVFPVDDTVAIRLHRIIDEYIAKNNYQKAQMQSVMDKAGNFGYHGSHISEAVDTIVAVCNEGERKDMERKMNEEMVGIRAANEMLRSHYEKTMDRNPGHTVHDSSERDWSESENSTPEPHGNGSTESHSDQSDEQRRESETQKVSTSNNAFDMVQAMNKRKLESARLMALQRRQREALFQYASRHEE